MYIYFYYSFIGFFYFIFYCVIPRYIDKNIKLKLSLRIKNSMGQPATDNIN